MNRKMDELKEILSGVIDPRDSRGKRHSILDILVIVVCGVMCGCQDFDDIEDYAKGKATFFKEYLDLWNGIPTAQTLRLTFRMIRPEEFMICFSQWIQQIVGSTTGKQIAIAGKAIRAAAEKMKNGNTPYVVNAYMTDIGLTIGQVKVEEKSNEITAIPKLLEMICIDGAIITIDAMGTQAEIMNDITSGGGDVVLCLKQNQKNAYEEVIEYFEQASLENDREFVQISQKI
jgi:predicted transposase YbfD/YdcC